MAGCVCVHAAVSGPMLISLPVTSREVVWCVDPAGRWKASGFFLTSVCSSVFEFCLKQVSCRIDGAHEAISRMSEWVFDRADLPNSLVTTGMTDGAQKSLFFSSSHSDLQCSQAVQRQSEGGL